MLLVYSVLYCILTAGTVWGEGHYLAVAWCVTVGVNVFSFNFVSMLCPKPDGWLGGAKVEHWSYNQDVVGSGSSWALHYTTSLCKLFIYLCLLLANGVMWYQLKPEGNVMWWKMCYLPSIALDVSPLPAQAFEVERSPHLQSCEVALMTHLPYLTITWACLNRQNHWLY